MKLILSFAFATLQAQTAFAFQTDITCDEAALLAARTHDIPPQVMLAITRAETGRSKDGALHPWPWAVNQAGTSHWFDTPDEAEAFVHMATDAGQTNIDIGCFQLNYRWHGQAFASIQDMFDPFENADYAARFLLQNHDRKGNWVDAVAAYHSGTPEHAKTYIEKVERILADLAPPPSPPQPERPTDSTRSNQFPLLQPGMAGAIASLVPGTRAASPLLIAMP